MNCVPLAKHAWRFAWHLGRTARPSQASLLRLSRFSARKRVRSAPRLLIEHTAGEDFLQHATHISAFCRF